MSLLNEPSPPEIISPVSLAPVLTAVPDRDLDPAVAFEHDVAIVGLGYVGLPTALAYHHAGSKVLALDISSARRSFIELDDVDLIDRDHERLRAALSDERFEITGDTTRIRTARSVIVCVPTPVDEHLVPDLSALRGSLRRSRGQRGSGAAAAADVNDLCRVHRRPARRPDRRQGLVAGRDIFVAFSAERIDPGSDTVPQEDVPRVVGGATTACAERAVEVLRGYADSVHRVRLARSCRDDQAPGEHVSRRQHRPGQRVRRYLPDAGHRRDRRDRRGRDQAVRVHGVLPGTRRRRTLHTVRPALPAVAAAQGPRRRTRHFAGHAADRRTDPPRWSSACELLSDRGRSLQGARVIVVGVAYKPDVADLRESPALEIIEHLSGRAPWSATSIRWCRRSCCETVPNLSRSRPLSRSGQLVLLHTVHEPRTSAGFHHASSCSTPPTGPRVGKPGVAVNRRPHTQRGDRRGRLHRQPPRGAPARARRQRDRPG